MDKKSTVNDLYQAAVISVLAVGYSMLGKKILKMTPPSIQKFDLEDTGKLVAIVAASEMTREHLIKQTLQKAQIEWAHKHQERIDFINKQLRLERKAETKFTELNDAMRKYHEVFGHELPPLPREPVLSDFYTPSDEQHHRELGFIALSMIGIGGVLYYFES